MSFTLTAKWICGSQEECKRAILEEKLLTSHVSTEINIKMLHHCQLIYSLIHFIVYAKSADLRSISEFDGANLINAKERIRQLVTEWGQY